jgi:leucyl-tRNA synthetase
MEYDFKKIESNWQKYWSDNLINQVKEDSEKQKFYVLDMFPYPSGAGLHVGHPLGYIASDIYARFKKLKGFNVLHPMGYDSFGLPTEQYAIQTGIHPAVATKINTKRYRSQLDKIGFSFDWSREVQTSDPKYYKWTQWIFKQLFQSVYCKKSDKAIDVLEAINYFKNNGNLDCPYFTDSLIHFTKEEWNLWSEQKKQDVLLYYRLAFLSETMVNWCPDLGTVLANDEVKNGLSERGGFPVEQKKMTQWSLRITAYADRLNYSLKDLDWSDSLKEIQRNWIGKSKGAILNFQLESFKCKIDVFTTRPDTVFGVNFLVLAPEHKLVSQIVTSEHLDSVNTYINISKLKTERDRQSDKKVSGVFTGSYAIHPFSGEKVAVWIADYVLAPYGTGAVMAVPCGDQRDWLFANNFNIDILNVFKDKDISESAYENKDAVIINSGFLNGLSCNEAIAKAIAFAVEKKVGQEKINYRLRDAVFSRQRYWGEPFPIYYKKNTPYLVDDDVVVELPDIDKYLPTKNGDPPLARAHESDWNFFKGDSMDTNIMPGWAGSSWYFLRFMDPHNETEFVSKEKSDYWNQVDLYIGGAEHAVGHLLYSRFWTKFLFDKGYISFNEPFKKLINQGMILGRSNYVYRVKDSNKFVTKSQKNNFETTALHVDINIVDNDILDIDKFKKWRKEYENAEFILEDGRYECGFEIEKMSKSKYNTQTPDDLIEKFGADTLRLYEMFLGPLEQFKPWSTKGINGVHNFLRKLWRHLHDEHNNILITENTASENSFKTIHRAIKRVEEDIERYSFNTVVSNLMICLNELVEQKCRDRDIISSFIILLSPYAPHIAEEIWFELGEDSSITLSNFPVFDASILVEKEFEYPISFNGKMRYKLAFTLDASKENIENSVMNHEKTIHYLAGKSPKKIIIVPKKIVNIVF